MRNNLHFRGIPQYRSSHGDQATVLIAREYFKWMFQSKTQKFIIIRQGLQRFLRSSQKGK